ncbi:hypothetical protein RYA05_01870 [Pseudomonas syringae pv. actinidiae]|nr:hypothetical protein [Pseudomonas syringae pv. actinidiae]
MNELSPDYYLLELSNLSGVSVNMLIADGWREHIQGAISNGSIDAFNSQITDCLKVIRDINARQTLSLLLLGFSLRPSEDGAVAKKTMPAGEMMPLCDLLIDKGGVALDTEITITIFGNERLLTESACGRYRSYEFVTCDLGLRIIAAATRKALWELSDRHLKALSSILGDDSAQLLERTGHARHAKTQCLTVSTSETNSHIELFKAVLGDLSMRESIDLLAARFEMDAAPHGPEMFAYRILQLKCVPDLYKDLLNEPAVAEDDWVYVAINSLGSVSLSLRSGGFQRKYGHYRTPEGRRALLAATSPVHFTTIPTLREVSQLTGVTLEYLIDNGFARHHAIWHANSVLAEGIADRILALQSLVETMKDDHSIDLLAHGFALTADGMEIAVLRKEMKACDMPIAALDFDHLKPSDSLAVEFLRNGWLQIYSADDCITHPKWRSGKGKETLHEALGA